MAIECCNGCVAPKRYPGCHDHCPEYIKQKAKHDKERIERYQKECISRRERARSVAIKVATAQRKQYKD